MITLRKTSNVHHQVAQIQTSRAAALVALFAPQKISLQKVTFFDNGVSHLVQRHNLFTYFTTQKGDMKFRTLFKSGIEATVFAR